MSVLSENLKRLRTEKGMTQDALAEKVGTSKQVLSRYENGLRIPKISMVQNLADALGVPLTDLSGDEPAPARPDLRKAWIKLSDGERLLTDEQLNVLYSMAHQMRPDVYPPLDELKG